MKYMLWQCSTKNIQKEIEIAVEYFQNKYSHKIVSYLVHKDVKGENLMAVDFIRKGHLGIVYE